MKTPPEDEAGGVLVGLAGGADQRGGESFLHHNEPLLH